MSAYLVAPHHAAYLACYYVKMRQQCSGVPNAPTDEAGMAQLLAEANMASLAARYGDSIDRAYVAECRRAAMQAQWTRFDPLQVIKAAQCFDYQACEVDDYDQTLTRQIVLRIISDAATDMEGYGEALWGAPEPDMRRKVEVAPQRTVRGPALTLITGGKA